MACLEVDVVVVVVVVEAVSQLPEISDRLHR